MKKIIFATILTALISVMAFAQPRPVDTSSKIKPKPAPESVPAKYEGGMFGFSQRQVGTLKFDDVNERIVFFDAMQKELFGIPYDSLLVIYPQSNSVTTKTGSVISAIPILGSGLGSFIKEKRRYMIVQFDDEDVNARGAVNFKIDDKELLDSVLQTLADKAQLTQRGDAFYKPKPKKSTT